MDVKMNEASGQALYKLCMENLLYQMDIFELVEDIGLVPDLLDDYFRGGRDLPEHHLARFARVCRLEPTALREQLEREYREAREQERLKEERERERRRQEEEDRLRQARKKQIMAEVSEYGIDSIRERTGYKLDDYYPLKFIMYFLSSRDYLPKLAELVRSASDQELVYKDTSALTWAAGGNLDHEKLLMLQDRKDFIAAHINDQDERGETALHRAAYGGNSSLEAISLLIEWGADVNIKDDELWTPLHCAAIKHKNNNLVWKILMEHGAEQTRNIRGETPEDMEERFEAMDAW